MKIDNEIINWLKNNNPESKEEVYKKFHTISEDNINHHLNNYYPDLLIEKNIDIPLEIQNKPKTFRQTVMDTVYDNVLITNKELYKVFPEANENSIRTYRNDALGKLKKTACDNSSENDNNTNIILGLKKINDSGRDSEAEQTKKSDQNKQSSPPELDLKKLEKKAYGENQEKEVLITVELIEQLIDRKTSTLIAQLKKQTKLIKKLSGRLNKMSNSENIVQSEDEIEKIVEEKVARIMAVKIQEIGTDLLSKVLAKSFGNMNISFGNK